MRIGQGMREKRGEGGGEERARGPVEHSHGSTGCILHQGIISGKEEPDRPLAGEEGRGGTSGKEGVDDSE